MNNLCGSGVGKRKRSIARVFLYNQPITAQKKLNLTVKHNTKNSSCDNYLKLPEWIAHGLLPLQKIDCLNKFAIKCTLKGGGVSGQSGALSLGLSKALLKAYEKDEDFLKIKGILKDNGLLTRDSRIVESKKAGQAKARKKFQFAKR